MNEGFASLNVEMKDEEEEEEVEVEDDVEDDVEDEAEEEEEEEEERGEMVESACVSESEFFQFEARNKRNNAPKTLKNHQKTKGLRRFFCASSLCSRSLRKAADGTSFPISCKLEKSLSNEFSSCFFIVYDNKFF